QTVFDRGDPHPVPVNSDNVFGVVSLVFWSVMIIVTVTYVLLVMRADNDGEGGIMALITLIRRQGGPGGRRAKMMLAALGIFGASLFFGDSVITPAISVLSAIEGVKVAAPSLSELVVPITAAIILCLFLAQRLGTGAVGRLFGPIMAVWFAAIGAIGIRGIIAHPAILKALSPSYAAGFLAGHFPMAFFSLAAIVLAVTGAEALYADMGHFGRAPITRAWLLLVFPACTLSYLGQGALVLSHPALAVRSPFFLLVPGWARIPMVVLAAAATVIASQAIISGAFSVAQQAAQLGYLPRLRILHTSEQQRGHEILHEHVIILAIETAPVPHVPPAGRLTVDDLGYRDDRITHVTARFGYLDRPDVPALLPLIRGADLESPLTGGKLSYFLSRIELRPGGTPGMSRWRKRLFLATSRITADAADHFSLPRERTVIMGSRIEL
ncbi:MAG: KUP/HAK/KT family potassium transporter, partial [Gemmatimonadota bacterium]